MATHHVDDALSNCHGYLSRALPPVLTVDSGDTVVFKTNNAGWNDRPPGMPLGESLGRRPEGAGHCLSGPVFVRGAEPGDALQIDIGAIEPCDWGTGGHRPGKAAISGILGGQPDDVAAVWGRHFEYDRARRVYPVAPGIAVPAAPFMGIYTVAPDAEHQPTAFPGPHGGNMDCKELRSGTTVYLPVFVPGALFSTGDGHGTQGDGEVDGAAVETGMDRLELTLSVRKDLPIERPRAETAEHLLFLAFGETLDDAAVVAVRDAMHYLSSFHGLPWDDAYNLCSIALDLRVTQVVDGPKGVHAMLPKAIFERPPSFAAR
jgi:acetamidase/formamidase